MAICLRRAFPYRNILFLHCRRLSNITLSPKLTDTNSLNSSASSFRDLFIECRRSFPKGRKSSTPRRIFAKGRKSKDSDTGNPVEVVSRIAPAIKQNATSQMDAAVVALSQELSKLRLGRASAGMLDHIIVETGGVKMTLSQMAVVSVLDPKTLSVTPYDPYSLKQLENAIVSSPLGLNPKRDGQRLIAVIPPFKEHEQVKAMCQVVSKSCEDVKQSIKRARLKAFDTMKKTRSSILKAVYKILKKEVDELTKKFIKSAENMCKAKEKEFTQG